MKNIKCFISVVLMLVLAATSISFAGISERASSSKEASGNKAEGRGKADKKGNALQANEAGSSSVVSYKDGVKITDTYVDGKKTKHSEETSDAKTGKVLTSITYDVDSKGDVIKASGKGVEYVYTPEGLVMAFGCTTDQNGYVHPPRTEAQAIAQGETTWLEREVGLLRDRIIDCNYGANSSGWEAIRWSSDWFANNTTGVLFAGVDANNVAMASQFALGLMINPAANSSLPDAWAWRDQAAQVISTNMNSVFNIEYTQGGATVTIHAGPDWTFLVNF